ncbi:MAG: GNAT family N-acetyltransferase [Chloroflexota bacterium]|nr:GNAT family N-acetyltransferase [Chloroflexota bacterium]
MSLLIRSFEPRDQDVARQLILAGLGEHFGWIDETRNPDLDDIVANYVESGHVFVVAEINGELVGTGALITESKDASRIVRMSVKQTHRRQGIGRALVAHLLKVASQKGFRQVKVSTEHDWKDAIGLYEHCGFNAYSRDDVNIYFSLVSPDLALEYKFSAKRCSRLCGCD